MLESKEPTTPSHDGAGTRHLKGGFKAKIFQPVDFDFGRLFESIFGWGEFRACRSGQLGTQVMEAAGAVATDAFQNITGQILFTTVMDAYQNEDFQFTKMIPTRQSPFLTGEKIPGITMIGDQATVVNEGEEFPLVGVSETYIETPDPRKRGLRVAVTREAVFGDRTGILLDRISKVSYSLGINKEKRAIDCVIDENAGASSDINTHRYKWRGDIIATYGNNTGTHSWDNLEASNALVDHTKIDLAEQLFANMLDPDTGEPISILADSLIVTPQLTGTAWRVLNSMMVSMNAGGYATTGNLFRTDSLSPIGKTEFSAPYKLVTSRLLAARMATDTTWYLGNIAKAFAWMENWPMRVLTAPPMSHEEFTRDIVTQYRVDERGAFATMDPRFMAKCTA